MKKYLSILFVAIFALVLTGCGGNTLKCSIDEDGSKAEVKIFFKGDKATKAETSYTIDAGSKETAEAMAEYYKGDKDTTVKVDGSKVIIKSTTTPSEDDEKVTKKEMKELLEEQGYKCK